MRKRPRILFVSHEASQTGAPLFLLGLHRWLKGRLDFASVFLLKLDGKISGDFRTESKTYLWDWLRPSPGQKLRFLVNRLRKLLLGLRLRWYGFDLVYLNSSSCSDILPTLRGFIPTAKWIMHVHELPRAIEDFFPEEFRRALPLVDRFIAVSPAVQAALCDKWSVAGERIHLVYPCSFPRSSFRIGEDVRSIHTIGKNTFLVGGAGEAGERKGTDLFLSCAECFFEQNPEADAVFLWLGEFRQEEMRRRFEQEVRDCGISGRVLLAGAHENAGDYFDAFDLLLLPSREDPFPLVALECAAAGKPIICFGRNNGCIAYVDNTCGAVVEYGSEQALTAAVERFYRSPEDRQIAGDRIRHRAKHYGPDRAGEEIRRIIEEMIEA